MNRIKHAVRTSTAYAVLRRYAEELEVGRWMRNGRPAPPPHLVKQMLIRECATTCGLSTLVETGTFLGDMVFATQHLFSQIYTIELDDRLYRLARKRFARASNVEVLHGDSGVVLRDILARLDTPALFWLDGHYSGGVTARGADDSPVMSELELIFSSAHDHAVLIDDARCFVGSNGYPTIAFLRHYISKMRPNYGFEIVDDVIQACPQRG